ncbi:hemolysin-III channel Izh2 protein [Rutstroemia sp. NJR-2017a WRK4]|nr:hemolysin-III channel Izh2 protein [Rutstroemia sp. NJR-2017a WRK4]
MPLEVESLSLGNDDDDDEFDEKSSMEMDREMEKEKEELLEHARNSTYTAPTHRRPASGSFLKSLKSIISIHNETINIHTHLLGSILFFGLPIFLYTRLITRYPTATTADVLVFSTFFLGVAICFALSAVYHTLSNHSKSIAAFGNQLDYLGVVILMWGSTIPSVYYGFYCDERVRDGYWIMISLLSLACATTTFHTKFRTPSLRPYRALMYSCLGLSASIFITHGLLLHGWETQRKRMSLDWMAVMAVMNLLGAGAYAFRVPEKWYPNRHDFIGSSHQIMHVAVVAAGLAHMVGLLRAVEHVHGAGFSCGVMGEGR